MNKKIKKTQLSEGKTELIVCKGKTISLSKVLSFKGGALSSKKVEYETDFFCIQFGCVMMLK